MKTLSVKTYLFILVASLLLITLGFQLLLIHLVKGRLLEEVDSKTLALSQQTIKFLLPQQDPAVPTQQRIIVPDGIEQNSRIRISVRDISHNLMPVTDNYGLVLGQGSKQVSIETIPAHQLKVKPVQLSNIAENGFVLSQQQSDGVRQRVVRFEQDESAIQRYFNDLFWGLSLISLVALISAFLLAQHISQPFRHLLSGFSKLGQGVFGAKLTPPQPFSPREAHAAVSGFNQMSDTLQQLDALKSKLKQQQQTLELGDVGRGLAHSLRNPLNTIGLAVEQLSQDALSDEKKAELAEQVRQKIRHMDKQIHSLLSLSGSNRGPLSSVVLQDVLQEILLETAGLGEPPELHLPKDPITLYANPIELRAIFHTPIINALEACPDKPISITLEQIKHGIRITIEDDGPGVSESIMPKLFEPHITDKPEGAGMGLYIAKRLCSSFYQGNIKVKNTASGCRVCITLQSGEQDND